MDDYSQLPPFPSDSLVEYRHIPGYFGYCAGTDGSILSALVPNKKKRTFASEWRAKKKWKNCDGYYLIMLRGDDGREHRLLAHTAILITFVGPRPKGFDTLHGNGIRDDNRLENLRWGTRRENMEDARRHGTLLKGERSHRAKLTKVRAKAVRDLRSIGWTIRDISALFDVSTATICATSNSQRWTDE